MLDPNRFKRAVAVAVAVNRRIGTELAGYRIEALLGRGGTSDVYLAEDRALERRVALKLLAPDLARDDRFRERFLRESQLVASLDHPNVIPIYEAGEFDGLLYIAMRYVEGRDLEAVLVGEGRLEPGRALALVEQIAGVLDAAHALGLVHRDVKPSNVLVERRGEVEHASLADFGVARATKRRTRLTEPGQLLGTVDYLAPEVIEGKGSVPASDVYALGCVLFQLLAGEVPFPRHSPLATAWAHVADEPPALELEDPALAGRLDVVVRRALAKEPGQRFGTARELAQAGLAAVSGAEGAAFVPPQGGWSDA
jgi:serine/threonine protein kinase